MVLKSLAYKERLRELGLEKRKLRRILSLYINTLFGSRGVK